MKSKIYVFALFAMLLFVNRVYGMVEDADLSNNEIEFILRHAQDSGVLSGREISIRSYETLHQKLRQNQIKKYLSQLLTDKLMINRCFLIACRSGLTEMAIYLINNYNADLMAQNEHKQNMIHLVILSNNMQHRNTLIQKIISMDPFLYLTMMAQVDDQDETPLQKIDTLVNLEETFFVAISD